MKDHRDSLVDLYPVLATLPAPDLGGAVRNARTITVKAGTTLFNELQPCDAFPFILSGALRIVKRAENGREILLYTVGPGDACVVSAACLLGRSPYNAVGIVQEDCELLMVPAAAFDALMAIKGFREAIFALFSQRVLDLMQLVDAVAFQKLDARLARVLIARGPEIAVSHQALADELGTVREMVTRILNGFADRGLVVLGRGSVRVVDAAGLKRVAGG